MKKIVVPVDITAASRNTMEYAAQLGKVLGAEIHLLHVDTEPLPVSAGPTPWTLIPSQKLTVQEASIDKAVAYLKEKYAIDVKGSVVTGYKSDSIKEAAADLHADLIVMGLKSGKRNKILGSTALKLIRKTTLPVLIVPEETRYEPLKNIILAIDFNERANSSGFDPLFEIIKAFNTSLRVLHVEEKGADLKASEIPGKLQLGRILSKVDYEYDKVEFDNIETGILNFVQDHPADLLVMVAHHHNLIERLSGPFHTQAISLELKLPLLVLK